MPLITLLLVLALAGIVPAAKDNAPQKQDAKTESVQQFYKYLRCHRQAKNIVVNWGLTSEAGVDHFVVYHSEDGEFFDPIEEIYPEGTLKYSYKHELVYPGYHHYYIKAIMNAGEPMNSVIDVVRIVGH